MPHPDPLELVGDSFMSALMDVVAAMEADRRDRIAAAIDERRLSVRFIDRIVADGGRVLVIEVATVDATGATPIARLDAARFGLCLDESGQIIHLERT